MHASVDSMLKTGALNPRNEHNSIEPNGKTPRSVRSSEIQFSGGLMGLADAPVAKKGFYVAHFLTVKDQARSRDFYVRVFGAKVVLQRDPVYLKLANSWLILNVGGGPTPDKPKVILETPPNPNRQTAFLNLRVADIWACYKKWKSKGAEFLTDPLDNDGDEWRCYIRDPDGYIIEVGQYQPAALKRFAKFKG